jgi:hypothetical protein
MKKYIQKVILSLILVVVIFTAQTASFISAQAPPTGSADTSNWYQQDFFSWYDKVYNTDNPAEIFGERYTAAQVEWIIYSLFAFLLNNVSDQNTSVACIQGDAIACTAAITDSIQKFDEMITNARSQSQIQKSNMSLAQLIFAEREFSGIGYIKNRARNFNIVPEAQAQLQGFGFGALEPVQGLWSATRNVAYSLAVFAIIVLAFMIMFRVKISPQIVISAQSAIPKVITALIFVTFSYAIAGFMIDLMYVVIGLLSLVFSTVMGTAAVNFTAMTEGVFGFGGFLMNMVAYSAAFFWILLFTLFIGSGNILLNVALTATGILPLFFIIIIVVVAIMLIFMFFKIFWLLLKTLAQTYLLVVIGPLQIMLGTIVPGLSVSSWIRSLAANLAVYPVVGLLFQLSFLFLFYSFSLGLGNITNAFSSFTQLFGFSITVPGATWSPPLTLGANYIPLLFLGISFVILTLIPKSAEIISGLLSGKPFAYGTALGEAMGAPKGLARFGLGYWGGRESEVGQEEYRKATTPGTQEAAKSRIKRGELYKTLGNTIR